MRNVKLLLFTIATVALALYSCTDDENANTRPQKYVGFTGTIEGESNGMLKAKATSWDMDDAIGVYMKNATAFIAGAQNVKYTTPGTGAFTPASTGIEFPADGSNVSFVAYYPWKDPIAGNIYPINIATQAPLSAIDLLYSNNAVDVNKTTPNVPLNFKHQLSQLIVNLSAGSGVNLTGLTASIKTLKTDGSFNIETGVVTLGTASAILAPAVAVASSASATANAILVPGQNLNLAEITFAAGGKTWVWKQTDIPNLLLTSGKKYTFNLNLTLEGGAIPLNPNGSIEDWTEGYTGGGITLTPNDDPKFEANKTTVSLGASATLSEVIALTTQATEAWTGISDQTWLTLAPASGTGSGNVTLTATANTGASRTATVTLTPTTGTLTPVTIAVTQAAASVTPSANLLFPGSDFEDWTAFMGCLSTAFTPPALKPYATQSTTGGRSGGAALYLNGAVTANEYVFTATTTTAIPSTATKIVFYIKGTATAKSLSFNVYSADAAAAAGYYKFNLGTGANGVQEVTVEATPANSYTGTINTGGQWVKVILNIAGYNLNTTGNIFALKTGSASTYDLYVDAITYE